MKSRLTGWRPAPAQWVVAAGALALLFTAVAAAVVGGSWGMVLMDALAPLCHQLADRSFAIGGVQMGLCHRCTAILSGLAVAVVLPPLRRLRIAAFVLLGLALFPMLVDWGLDVAGLLANTTASRVVTGLWGGAVIGLLIGRAAVPPASTARR